MVVLVGYGGMRIGMELLETDGWRTGYVLPGLGKVRVEKWNVTMYIRLYKLGDACIIW